MEYSKLSDQSAQMKLDRFDLAILQEIAADGRISITDLAKLVGLSKSPTQLHGKVLLLNVSVAAAEGMRVYRDYRQEIEQLAGKINGRFATLNWVPIRLFTKPFPFEEMVAYYRAAHVAFIPPLRDGLNLVAKEYIAAKQGTGGALILSEFTGSAVELPDAILTNPHSFNSLDSSLDLALEMPLEEQQRRMKALFKAVSRYDVNQWAYHLFREAMAISRQDDPDSPQDNSSDKPLAQVA